MQFPRIARQVTLLARPIPNGPLARRFTALLVVCVVLAQPLYAQIRHSLVAGTPRVTTLGFVGGTTYLEGDYVPSLGLSPSFELVLVDRLSIGATVSAAGVTGQRYSGWSFSGGPRVAYYFGRHVAEPDTVREGSRKLRVRTASRPVYYYLAGTYQQTASQIDLNPPEDFVRYDARLGRLGLSGGTVHMVRPGIGIYVEATFQYDMLFRMTSTGAPFVVSAGARERNRAGIGASVSGGLKILL